MMAYDYFRQELEQPPREPTLRKLHVDSPCGADCKKVIDAAKVLLDLVDPLARPEIIDGVNTAVEVFWIG
jgi:hypothetical protein